MKKVCFLFGHREAPTALLQALDETIERHIISYGVTEFVVGSRGGFDRLAAQALQKAKRQHPHIVLTLLVPYLNEKQNDALKKCFDETLYPAGLETVPLRYAIVRANHYAVDYADYVIAYVWDPASNTRNLLEYTQKSRRKKQPVITLLGREDAVLCK